MSQIPVTCVAQMLQIIDDISSGGVASPVSFWTKDCSGEPYHHENRDGVNTTRLTSQICESFTNCEFPVFRTILVPPGVNLQFSARTKIGNLDTSSAVFDVGLVNLNNGENTDKYPTPAKGVRNNLWTTDSGSLWGSNSKLGGDCRNPADAGSWFSDFMQTDITGYAGNGGGGKDNGKMFHSLLSCGDDFWPSFLCTPAMIEPISTGSFRPGVITGNDVREDDTGNCKLQYTRSDYCANNNPHTYSTISSFSDGVPSSGKSRQATPFRHSNHDDDDLHINACADDKGGGQYDNSKTPVPRPITYGTCDYIYNVETAQKADPLLNNIGCVGAYIDYANCQFTGSIPCSNFTSGVDPVNVAVNGSTESFRYSFIKSTWFETQAAMCINDADNSIAGIKIARYGSGTPACDLIMSEICDNSALLNSSPDLATACVCIIEQKKLNQQFAGIDLPIHCFLDICSDSNPKVYKTVASKNGCSAKLCRQVLDLHGTAISSQGFQAVSCNGKVVSVDQNLPKPVNIPDVTTIQEAEQAHKPKEPEIGSLFYISLGLLVFMVVLLLAWVIRRYVLTRRKKKQILLNISDTLSQLQ